MKPKMNPYEKMKPLNLAYTNGYEDGYEQGKRDAVVHGRWSDKQASYTDGFGNLHFGFQCMVCHAIVNKGDYCSACGAKMDAQ